MKHSNIKKALILCLLALGPIGCAHSGGRRANQMLNLGAGGIGVLLVALPIIGVIALVDAANSSGDDWREDSDSDISPKSRAELERKWDRRRK
jgi:hypothetical protein